MRRITVYCPITPATLSALTRGELETLAHDPGAGPVLRFIEQCADLGALGSYSGVCEVSLGLETFTPGAAARPTLGAVGARAHSATAVLTTYAAATLPAERLDAIVAEIARRHPWELPVIELSVVELVGLTPASTAASPAAG